MVGLIVPGLMHPESVSRRIWWTVPLIGVFFCGWICPFGAAQDWLAKIARKFHLPYIRIPWKYQKFLQFSRYIWAGFILFIGVHYTFLSARFYFNDNLFQNMLTWASGLTLIIFLTAALFTDRPFCNYFCMKGALDGLMSIVRPISIGRDSKSCVHCSLCEKLCPMNVRVEHSNFVRHPNCINCMKCLTVCPKQCLSFRLMSFKKGIQKSTKTSDNHDSRKKENIWIIPPSLTNAADFTEQNRKKLLNE